jgi:hypothetical protein
MRLTCVTVDSALPPTLNERDRFSSPVTLLTIARYCGLTPKCCSQALNTSASDSTEPVMM